MVNAQEAVRMLKRMESEVPPEVQREQEIQQHGANQLASNAYQKLIESKEKELRESIMGQYSRIKEVERELTDLTLQLQVNVGPRKHALEMLRAKIEKQNEKVAKIRAKYMAAKQVMLTLEEELAKEEAAKDLLCSELGLLVQQSATSQLAKLEELKNHLDTLNRGVRSGNNEPIQSLSGARNAAASPSSPVQQHPAQHPAGPPPTNGSQSQASEASTSGVHNGSSGTAQQQADQTAGGADGGQSNSRDKADAGPSSSAAGANKSRTGSKAGSTDGQQGGGREDVHRQKLLADVAAARAKHAGGAAGAGASRGGSPRISGTGGGGGSGGQGSPQRRAAPAGASLMTSVMPMQRQEAQSAAGAQPASAKASRFSGFDT